MPDEDRHIVGINVPSREFNGDRSWALGTGCGIATVASTDEGWDTSQVGDKVSPGLFGVVLVVVSDFVYRQDITPIKFNRGVGIAGEARHMLGEDGGAADAPVCVRFKLCACCRDINGEQVLNVGKGDVEAEVIVKFLNGDRFFGWFFGYLDGVIWHHLM